jgi:hypothetical protein
MACEACTVLNGMREHWWSVLAESPLFCCNYLLTSRSMGQLFADGSYDTRAIARKCDFTWSCAL